MMLLLILATAVCATLDQRTNCRPTFSGASWMACGWRATAQPWRCGPTFGDCVHHFGIVCRVGLAACMQAPEMSCDDASVLLGNNAYLLVLLIMVPLALLQGASAVAIFQLGVVFIATESIIP